MPEFLTGAWVKGDEFFGEREEEFIASFVVEDEGGGP